MKQQTDYNKLIGRVGDEYYYLECTFKESDSFKGATGFSLRPITKSEAESRRDDFDDDGQLWRMAVETKQTELGMDAWHEQVKSIDGDDSVFDLSWFSPYGEDLIEKLNADIEDETERYELTEVRGCGRCFDVDRVWDELFEPALWEVIKEFETKEVKA